MSGEMYPKPPCPDGKYYTVKKGDTMYLIAKRYDVCLDQLIAANPQVKNPDLIYPGQVLCIPKKVVEPYPDVTCPGGFIYVVKPSDTLSSIAKMFSTSVDSILAANPQIKDPSHIFPGQRICIPCMPPLVYKRYCFTMYPTHYCTKAVGMGMYDMESRDLMVITRGLPDPRRYGMEYMALMTGYDGMGDYQSVEMRAMTDDIMMCRSSMHLDWGRNPVFLIGAARRIPFFFGPLFLFALIRRI